MLMMIAGFPLDEVLRGFARHEHHADDVGLQDRVELRAIHVNERTPLAECGVVHQNVEVAELVEELTIRPRDVVFAADVGLDRMRANRFRRFGQSVLDCGR